MRKESDILRQQIVHQSIRGSLSCQVWKKISFLLLRQSGGIHSRRSNWNSRETHLSSASINALPCSRYTRPITRAAIPKIFCFEAEQTIRRENRKLNTKIQHKGKISSISQHCSPLLQVQVTYEMRDHSCDPT